MNCWDPISYPASDVVTRRFGPLVLHLRRRDDEWHAAVAYAPAGTGRNAAPASAAETAGNELLWQRWVVRDGSGGLTLTPVVPDKSVVVRPQYPLALPSRQLALFFVTVPAWVRVGALPDGTVLLEVPPVILSKIWYGDFASGELCYSLKSRATRHLDDEPAVAWHVTCPVQVSNQSNKDLLLERLCIHVQHLGIFEGGGRLWTPLVSATFRDDDQVAEVTYELTAPPGCQSPVKRSEPRAPVTEQRFWRTVRDLASMHVF